MPTIGGCPTRGIAGCRKTVLGWLLLGMLLSGCTLLPDPPPTAPVYALPAAPRGELEAVAKRFAEQHPIGYSGFLPLHDNAEALQWRLALIDHATTAIDLQYFIWQGDAAGRLLFKRLMMAADRGVRVRMLVDDLGIATRSKVLAAICRHPNFEIRIFNPGRVRESTLGALGEFILYFKELNRRMHNKLFVVDNHLAIVGGRNIGNEYFGLKAKYNFRDLDVLTVGPVVTEISHAFDDYWNAELAYPGGSMSTKTTREDLQAVLDGNTAYLEAQREELAGVALEPESWHGELVELSRRFEIGGAHFLQDQPILAEGAELRLTQMINHLAAPSHKELIILTPYMIPVGNFLERLSRLAAEGVRVKILTGSLGSNNHTVAHSHYKKYRKRLLKTGAELYEFRHDPSLAVMEQAARTSLQSEFISLHVKALVGDRQRCFIGSLNLDPRAIELNTENGLYIQSQGLCGGIAAEFDQLMALDNAWRVRLDENGRLYWESPEGRVDRQPARGFGQRVADFFFRLLPIEGQL